MDKKDKLKEVVDQAIASQHVPHVKLKKMGPTSVDIDKLTKPSKETHQEYWGQGFNLLGNCFDYCLSCLNYRLCRLSRLGYFCQRSC